MRVAFQMVTVFERARFAFVAVYRQIAGTGIGAYKAPFGTRRESSATQSAQTGLFHLRLHLFPIAVVAQVAQGAISAIRLIFGKALIIGNHSVGVTSKDRRLNLFDRRVIDVVVAQFQRRGSVAAAHAGRAQDADLSGVKPVFQCMLQRFGSGQFARQRIADPDGQGRGRGFAFFDHVEMGVKSCHFVHFGLRNAHFFGQGPDMRRREVAICILDQVQKFDQQIAAARAVAQQNAHLIPCRVFQLASLGRRTAFAAAASGRPDTFLLIKCHGCLPIGWLI